MRAENAARDAGGLCGPIPGYGGSPAGRRRLIGRHCYQHRAPGEEGDGPQGTKKAQEEQKVKTKMEGRGLLERTGLMVEPEGRSPS